MISSVGAKNDVGNGQTDVVLNFADGQIDFRMARANAPNYVIGATKNVTVQ